MLLLKSMLSSATKFSTFIYFELYFHLILLNLNKFITFVLLIKYKQ
nr:MAG TPA: hypothetical protein [Caudoviricetes sp.]DAX37855.1 MAG TPA: hypothetical protein [Caudoviricetes sp.]